MLVACEIPIEVIESTEPVIFMSGCQLCSESDWFTALEDGKFFHAWNALVRDSIKSFSSDRHYIVSLMIDMGYSPNDPRVERERRG